MIFFLISAGALLFGILGDVQIIEIPDPLLEALIGVLILSAAEFMRRRYSWK